MTCFSAFSCFGPACSRKPPPASVRFGEAPRCAYFLLFAMSSSSMHAITSLHFHDAAMKFPLASCALLMRTPPRRTQQKRTLAFADAGGRVGRTSSTIPRKVGLLHFVGYFTTGLRHEYFYGCRQRRDGITISLGRCRAAGAPRKVDGDAARAVIAARETRGLFLHVA